MSDNLLNITVHIAGRPYKMKVSSLEERNVRTAAKMINDKLAEYQKAYGANDQQDYLAMVTLLYTSEFLKKDSASEAISGVVENALTQIEAQLDDFVI